ncbi:UDP-2,4-diacetamido-2,4,6-trideoxy-beta-L-altropyranose hydrolase [Gymnodinialimonas hymeniacidonis]|uniref:UDP-2,4-diacetamido-2,4, 6-trideoxy-beta-L-altropyranose hydrolase n=1 Tax=Gymnodinialimonas hymeniacidonis TaxID=3126508 RepID=UPI0034C5EBD6
MNALGTSRIAFVATASAELGGGHIMRCLSLARAIYDDAAHRCAAPLFLIGHEASRFAPALQSSGMAVIEIERDPAKMVSALLAHWPDGADWLVLDEYAFDVVDEHVLRGATNRIAVIDDAPTRMHDCDLLIDSKSGRLPAEYKNLAPETSDLLCGARYALLNPDFAARRAELAQTKKAVGAKPPQGESALRVFVSFGMTDVGGLTLETVQALSGAGYLVDAVIGAAAPTAARLAAFAKDRSDVTVHVDTPNVADLMMAADLAVGAAGGTSHERCCLGLPTVAVPVVDNQLDIAAELTREGAAHVIGAPNALPDGAQIRAALDHLASDTIGRAAMAQRAARLCDGLGAQRVARVLSAADVSLRQADMDDAKDVWTWRNSDDSVKYFESAKVTPLNAHLEWFEKALRDPKIELFIAESKGVAVGHLRLDHSTLGTEASAEIRSKFAYPKVSICMAPVAKGLGLGRASLLNLVRYASAQPRCAGLSAQVHVDNTASRRLFESLRFQGTVPRTEGSFMQFTLTFGDPSQ